MTNTTPLLTPAARIFVAGHRGMAGSAICREMKRPGEGDFARRAACLTATSQLLPYFPGLKLQPLQPPPLLIQL